MMDESTKNTVKQIEEENENYNDYLAIMSNKK